MKNKKEIELRIVLTFADDVEDRLEVAQNVFSALEHASVTDGLAPTYTFTEKIKVDLVEENEGMVDITGEPILVGNTVSVNQNIREFFCEGTVRGFEDGCVLVEDLNGDLIKAEPSEIEIEY